jgi:hypothetical protein
MATNTAGGGTVTCTGTASHVINPHSLLFSLYLCSFKNDYSTVRYLVLRLFLFLTIAVA